MKPKKLGRVVLKEEFFAITGCLEEAIVLNQMCYWSERVEETDKFLEEEYTMLVEHVPVLAHGWIYKSASELAGELFGAVSEKTMNRILDRLVKKNFLRRRFNPNPKYKFDKTYHYRVNFVEIMCQLKRKNMPLSGYQIIEECVSRLDKGVAPKRHFDGSEHQVDGAIPETTSNTTTEITPIVPLEGDNELFPSDSISTNSTTDSSLGRSSMDSRPSASTDYMARFKTKANRLMNRRDSTPWSKKEMISARPHLNTCDEDWAVLEKYYACRGQDGFFHRTSMLTLLNNFAGEIDKAKSKFPPAPQIPDEKTDPVAAGLYWKNLVNRD